MIDDTVVHRTYELQATACVYRKFISQNIVINCAAFHASHLCDFEQKLQRDSDACDCASIQ